MTDELYGFHNESDIDRISLSVRKTEARTRGGGFIDGFDLPPYFAKITELVDGSDGKRAKGIQVIFNSTSLSYIDAPGGWVFDDDDTTINGEGDIYNDTAMTVDQIVEVSRYNEEVEKADKMAWLVPKASGGGGAERPAIITQGATFEFGAQITAPNDATPITEFTDGQYQFKALLPWGDDIALPDDFKFVGDLFGTTYFTESYPKSIWAKPNETYPTSGGLTDFRIYDSASVDNGTLLYNSQDVGNDAELILENFANGSASVESREYFDEEIFPCSYNPADGNFYFTHPLFK